MSFPIKRLPLAVLLLSLLLCLLLSAATVESRRYEQEPQPHQRHRHRHRHELTSQQRWPTTRRRTVAASDEDDYEESYAAIEPDYEDYVDDELEDEHQQEFGRRGYSGLPRRTSHHRYDSTRYHHPVTRYHHRGGGTHHGRIPSHHRTRLNHRKRYEDEQELDEEEEEDKRLSRRRYEDTEDEENLENEGGYYLGRHGSKSNSRKRISTPKSRYESRRDWRYKLDDDEEDYDADDESEDNEEDEELANRPSNKHSMRKARIQQDEPARSSSKLDEWLRLTRPQQQHTSSGVNDTNTRRRTALDDQEEEDEELELWKEQELDEDKELNNDFYKSDQALKTYDDIIRKLTEDRTTTTTTPRPTTQVKRNSEIEGHLQRDAYGNLRLLERNANLTNRGRSSSYRSANLLEERPKKKSQLEEEEEEDDDGTQADANVVSIKYPSFEARSS